MHELASTLNNSTNLCKVCFKSPCKDVWFSHIIHCLIRYQCLCIQLPKLIKLKIFFNSVMSDECGLELWHQRVLNQLSKLFAEASIVHILSVALPALWTIFYEAVLRSVDLLVRKCVKSRGFFVAPPRELALSDWRVSRTSLLNKVWT